MLILLDAQDLRWYRTKPTTARRNITLHNPTPAWHTHMHTRTHTSNKNKNLKPGALTLSSQPHHTHFQWPYLKINMSRVGTHYTHCVDRTHTKTHPHQYMRRQITYWKEECGLALEQNSSFHACPPRLSTPCTPPAPPHTPPAIKRRLSPIRQKHWSRLSIRAMTSAGVRPAWWGPVFPPLQKFSVKSCISPLKHLMISLKDRPLTTRQFPHSSLLYADWLGTAFSRHASMNRNTSKVLTYTQQKGTHLQGMLQKCFLDWDEMHIWQQMEG